MSKRLISMLTAMAMLMTLLVFPAYAEGEEAIDTAEKLAAAIENGGTVTIAGDITLTDDITITKDVTLTADEAVTLTTKGVVDVFTVTGGVLTIGENITVDSDTSIIWANGGQVVIDGAALTSEENGYAMIFAEGENSKVTVEDGVIASTVSAITIKNGAQAEINGGDISTTGASSPVWANGEDSIVTVNGGVVTAKIEDTQISAAYASGGGEIIVDGGELAVNNSSCALIASKTYAQTGGKVTVKSGEVNGVLAHEDENSVAVIEGGTIMGNIGVNDGAALTVTGGTFENDPTAYVADGYEAFADGEGYTVGTAKLNSEADLIAAIENGGEVKLEDDICITAPIVVENTVTLDMNGFEIYNEADIWNIENKDWSLISVRGGNLTITGEGKLSAKENDCYAVDVQGGVVTIENGTLIGNISAVYVLEGTANIEGGEYSIQQLSEHEDERFTLNCLDENYPETANIIVTGGTFNKFNPAANLAEGEGTSFVADGYEVSENEGVYTVSEIVVTPPPADEGGEGEVTPPAEDDEDDYVPSTPAVAVKGENGQTIKAEKQSDGSLKIDVGENTAFAVDTPDGKDAVVNVPMDKINYGMVAVIVNADGSETVIANTVPGESGISFTVADGQTVKIVDKSQTFDDVAKDGWDYNAVTFAAARGIVNGVGNGRFEPETAATRGMVMTMLARLSGADTTGGVTWFSKGMDWAKEMGISDGTNPEAEITREQLIVMLWRLEGQPTAKAGVSGFDDAESVSDWADGAMAWAVETGLVQGSDNALMPTGSANRNQTAQILMNFICSHLTNQ